MDENTIDFLLEVSLHCMHFSESKNSQNLDNIPYNNMYFSFPSKRMCGSLKQ